MNNLHDIANSPISFTLSGKEYKVRRLSLLDYFAEFQAIIKQDYFNDTIKMASQIKDNNERVQFQVQSMKGVPKGDELENMAFERISTIDGETKILEMVLRKDNKVTDSELKDILSNSDNVTTIKSIILFARGIDVVEDKVEENAETAENAEKKS